MSREQDIEAAKAALAAAEAEPVVVAEEKAALVALVVAEAEPVDTAWLEPAVSLDSNRPYGRVMDGSGTSRARYQQDGKFFDFSGELIKE